MQPAQLRGNPRLRRGPPPDEALEAAARARLGPGAVVCGVDEAGRGPWAGPLCVAAVAFAPGAAPAGLADSKTLAAPRRAALADAIRAAGLCSVVFASVEEIDRLGLGRAWDLAVARAVAGLPTAAFVLIDGARAPPGLPCAAQAVTRGDARSVAVAAASILAKTARDAVMDRLAAEHPGYGWESNRGYGTAAHLAALRRLGVTPHHRRSFRPIHNILREERHTSI